MDTKRAELFRFRNQRQEEIYKSLNQFVTSAPASLYKDACKIIYGDNDLEAKVHLLGHLLREIYGWVLDYMLPIDFVDPPKRSKDRNKKKILAAAKFFHLSPKSNLVQDWIKIHRKLHSKAHRDSIGELQPINKDFMDLWDKTELILDFLLDKISKNYLLYKRQIDKSLKKKTLTTTDFINIKKHIPLNQITLSYLFDTFEKTGHINVLRKTGFFKFPRKPLYHADGGVSYPLWPQMTYLARMSKIVSEQNDVLQVCLNLETENINTQVQVLEIALSLPPDKALKIVTKSYSWFDQISSWFHPEKFGQLLPHLLSGGYDEETLALAKRLLAIKPDPRKPKVIEGYTFPYDPIALFDDWHYEKILQDDYPAVVDKLGMGAVKLLLDIIENYVEISDPTGKKQRKDTSSVIWRPAIEDNSQNHKIGVRDLLITGARDAAERYLKSHPDKILEVIAELEKRKLNIFKRLALHLLRLFPKGAEKKIVKELMNKEEFDGRSVRLGHEYYLLAETHCKLLSTKQREQVWSRIMTGADKEDYKEYKIKIAGRMPPDEETKRYEQNWQMYHLIPFRNLGDKWSQYLENLKTVLGEPEFPSFSSWMKSGSWGPASSISSDQLKLMRPNQLVEYLKKWEPPENDPLDRSREGTGRELTGIIASDPEKWANEALLFDELDPTYVRSFLSGFRESLKQGKKFNWKPILQLCKSVLKKPIKVEGRKRSVPFGDDPDWGWCRNTIVELIEDGLKTKTGVIPLNLRKESWEVIKELTDDPSPTPEKEKEQLTNSDPLTVAINTTRGDAMAAAIQYGIWLKEDANKEHKEWSLNSNAPELKTVLEDHLNINKDPSLAIRSVYGEKLGALVWLDKKWVKETQDNIFPKEITLKNYFDAAWETYIGFVSPYNDVLALIEPQYWRAIHELGQHSDRKHHLENPDERLAQHLMAFYWSGVIDFKKKDGILSEFYKYAPIKVRTEVIEFMGRSLKDASDISVDIKTRLINLLEIRLLAVKKSKTSKDDYQEFQGFGWWISSGKLDIGWCLKKLCQILKMGCDLEGDHLIIEKFVEIASTYPLETIQCSSMMVENDRKGWGVVYWKDELRSVISSAVGSNNGKAVKAAKDFVNRLASRGHLDFNDLIS